MTTATMSYGVRARERLPFAWDGVTLGLVAMLLLVGMIMVTSASMSIAAKDFGDPFYFLERQFVFALCGVAFAWLMTRVPTELWHKYSLALILVESTCVLSGYSPFAFGPRFPIAKSSRLKTVLGFVSRMVAQVNDAELHSYNS